MKMYKVFFFSFILFLPLTTFAVDFDNGYTYCRKFTATDGGESGGIATTTTSGIALIATSTISALAHTTFGGNVTATSSNFGTTTPTDVLFTDGSDCQTDEGNAIPFGFEKYVDDTGEFVAHVNLGDVASSSPSSSQNVTLLFYGQSGASDQSDFNNVYAKQGEVAVYKLNEDPTDPTTIFDLTSNVYHASSTGSMTTADVVGGQIDGSLDFDGSNDGVVITDNADFTFSAFTFSFWVNGTDWTATRFPLSKGNNAEYHMVSVTGPAIRLRIDTSSGNQTVDTATLSEGKWHHVVGSWDGATIRIYSNGQFDGSAAIGGSMSNTSADVHIGARDFTTADVWNGQIDDVRFFNNALDRQDIKTIYNNTSNSAVFWTIGGEETKTVASTEEVSNSFIRTIGD